MSARLPTSADFFYRGGAWTDSAYPAPVALPDMNNFAMTGLCRRENVAHAGYEAVVGASERFGASRYHFFGWPAGSVDMSCDTQQTSSIFGLSPANLTWFQFALRGSGSAYRALWKLPADTGWHLVNTIQINPYSYTRFFLGCDEYGDSIGALSLSNLKVFSGGTAGAMSDAELLAEADSVDVLRVTDRFAWYKMKPGFLTTDSFGFGRVLSVSGTPIDGADSPLEAPADAPLGGNAVGVAAVRGWSSSGSGVAAAIALGTARTRGWSTTGGSAFAVASANGAATDRRDVASGSATARAIANGSAKTQRWRAGGTAIVTGDGTPVDPGDPGPLPDIDVFTRIRGRAANVIAKYGADVSFTSGITEPAHQDENGQWIEAQDGSAFGGKGIQTRGSPDEVGLMNDAVIVLRNPVTVLVAAVVEQDVGVFVPIDGVPVPGLTMRWALIDYNVKFVLPVAPNGVPIYYVVVGDT